MTKAAAPFPQRSTQRETRASQGDLVLVLDGEEVRIPPSALTHDGFRNWARNTDLPKRPRYTFVDNQLYVDNTLQPLDSHNQVEVTLLRGVMNLNVQDDLGEYYGHGALFSNAEAGVSSEPDGMLATWQRFESKQVRFVSPDGKPDRYMELEGSPDWLMEIVSDSSVTKDTIKLRKAYHAANVAEYWLIDARGDEIDFQILLHGHDDFVNAPTRRGGWQESRVFKRLFRLTRKRGRMNLWKYTLEVKPVTK